MKPRVWQAAAAGKAIGTARRRWLWTSWLVLGVCIASAVLLAGLWRSSVRDQHRNAFQAEAVGVASTIATALRRMDDFVVSARTTVQVSPDTTNAEFAAWADSLDASRRYPGTLGLGYVVPVTAAGLQKYGELARSDPGPGVAPIAGPFVPRPEGSRPLYCFARLTTPSSSDVAPLPANFDICSLSDAFFVARDSGQFTVLSLPGLSQDGVLALLAPMYRGGKVPTTLGDRRRLIMGWMSAIVDAGSVLKSAVEQHPNLGVTLTRQDVSDAQIAATLNNTALLGATAFTSNTYRAPSGTGVGAAGKLTGQGLMRSQFSLAADGLWSIEVRGSSPSGERSADQQGLVVLGGGVLGGLLLFALLQVLARSRGRALQLVDERTDELRFQAMHDALTGLPNRLLIMDRAEQLLANSRRSSEPVAALFIDLDGFKGVNDSFGHPAGDQLLVAVAARLQQALREGDTVGRLGGDEFVVLTPGTSSGPNQVAERILDVLRAPFALDTSQGETLISITASIGIAAGLRAHAPDLLRDADIALYGAKAQGKDCYVVFRPEMHVAVTDRMAMEMDLRCALEAREFHLAYQPTVHLEDGSITGVEALLRWDHPKRGLIPPMEFIPLAEQTGIIKELGRWVLKQACVQGASWHAAGRLVDMSVNISGRQLDDPGIVDDVRAAITASGMDPRRLVLEITETTLMRDADASAVRLTELKALGIRVAIDDFGTGYSSLAYLQKFPVDLLKIDRSFITGLADSDASARLVDTLVQLGKTLGLGTLAEGIEDDAQLAYLKELDCDSGQGFLFARPLDPESVERLFDNNRTRIPAPRIPMSVGGHDVLTTPGRAELRA